MFENSTVVLLRVDLLVTLKVHQTNGLLDYWANGLSVKCTNGLGLGLSLGLSLVHQSVSPIV